ncbi:MAG TPA: 30S ribosomal protein S16 [Candidatus Pacebacteria bacterium]|nr:30S ribosomal protein S16 [Candidatus Paceibacterota bacterium]
MLVIRFNRVGRHNHAQYRIVVQEKTKAPSGKSIAIVGSYDPHSKQTILKEDEIKNYIANGAQPSDSVYNLLVRNGVIEGEKRTVKLPEKKVEEKEESGEVEEGRKEESAEKNEEAKEEKTKDKKEEKAPVDSETKADKEDKEENVKEEKSSVDTKTKEEKSEGKK